ncbi:MAG: dTMP kinase [Kiritimatiellia bacterium]
MKSTAPAVSRSAFITFEGPEGCGKSSQILLLADRIRAAGISLVCTREPGGTPAGEAIRELLQHDKAGEGLVPEAEVLLFLASRAQLVRQVILPALEAGQWVVCDRYIDSTVAYQGYGREFGPERIAGFNNFVVGPALPDLTLLLDIDVQKGYDRMEARNRVTGGQHDRMELQTAAFHERMRQGYLELARKMPDRIRVVNADRSPEAVSEEVWKVVCDVLLCARKKPAG